MYTSPTPGRASITTLPPATVSEVESGLAPEPRFVQYVFTPWPWRRPSASTVGWLNGHVERAQRTHKEEFYEVRDLPDSLEGVNKILRVWEEVYNCYRPHQALGYLTPKAFYQRSSQTTV